MDADRTADEKPVVTSADGASKAARVVVYTRAGCHLCDEACAAVERVCCALSTTWTTVDIESSDDLRARYSDYVPVVLVDGVQQGFWRIDEDRLRRLLVR